MADIGLLGGAFEGFARGMMDMEDRKMKQLEFDAKISDMVDRK